MRIHLHSFTEEERADIERKHRELCAEYDAWVSAELRRFLDILPRGWRVEMRRPSVWCEHERGLRVMLSGRTYGDGRRWLHLSVSRVDRVPNWADLRTAKELFFGVESKAVQVFPPKSQWVNIDQHTLHLWRCVDEDVLPDFRTEVGGRLGI